MKSVLAKIRSEYRNLNIDNIGLSAEGIGGYSVIRTLYGLSEDWQDDVSINVNCTLLVSPITNLKTNGEYQRYRNTTGRKESKDRKCSIEMIFSGTVH